jgi:hypothetical protein
VPTLTRFVAAFISRRYTSPVSATNATNVPSLEIAGESPPSNASVVEVTRRVRSGTRSRM